MRLLFHDFEIPYLLQDGDYPVGGACIRQYAFAQGLAELGQEVGLLTWEGAHRHVSGPVDFTLVESYPLQGGPRKIRWFTQRFPALLKAVRGFQPDFLFQKSAASQTGVMAFLGQRLKVPFIYLSTNDIDADDRLKSRLNVLERLLFSYGLKKSTAIVCQNSYQHEAFRARFPGKSLICIKNPYFPSSALPDIPSREGRDHIAWMGLFHPQKNLPLLYEIARALPDFRFKIAGRKLGPVDEATAASLRGLENCPHVEFVGYLTRSQILPFLSRSYCLLNTSHYEGFSNTFLEAFAAGTPVVTLGENPDGILDSHKMGFVIDKDGIPSLFESFKSTFDYPDYGRRSREYLSEHHDYRTSARQLVHFLQGLR